MNKKRITPLIVKDKNPKQEKMVSDEETYFAKVVISSPTEVWEEHTCQTFAELYFILHLIANNLVVLALQDTNKGVQ